MNRVLQIFLLPCTIALFPVCAKADADDPYFVQHYDNRNGLSNSSINYLFSDASNLLWVATWDGLNLYDGSLFHVFNYSKESDSRSIGSNVIQQVTEDKRGNIWITTIEGISRYAKQSGSFFHYFYSRNTQSRISENEYMLAVDTAGAVFCFNKKNGLSRYDATLDRFVSCGDHRLTSTLITSLFFDHNNRLWVLNNNGELSILSSDTFLPVPGFAPIREVAKIFKTGDQTFYTTTANALLSINGRSLQGKEIMQLPYSLSTITFYNDHFLLGWASKGCGSYSADFKPENFLGQQASQLQNVRITAVAAGSEDILWCGTDGNGIIKIYPRTKPFGTISTSSNGVSYNGSVRAFCRVGGDLWVGTKGSGITVMKDFWINGNRSVREMLTYPSLLDNNSVYAITKGLDDLVYIGTDGKGVGIYDERSRRFYKWSEINGATNAQEFGSVYAIKMDPDGSAWLGTSSYGLIHLKIERDKNKGLLLALLEKYPFRGDNTGPANDIIYALEDGGDSVLWIGCRYGGLSILNKKTRTFKSFKAFTYDGSLSNNDVLSLFKDNQNRLWVGTSYGLNWVERDELYSQHPQFRKLTMQEGLPNNTIHAIEQDSTGNIWISSNKGLACINPNNKISYYQQVDGLQSNEFCDGAVWKDGNGLLYFGGIYGFNQFMPHEIRRSSWTPNLLISGLLIGDDPASRDGYRVVSDRNSPGFSYNVNRNLNFFELDVQALSYLNAEKCEYAYYLAGYDKQWKYSGTNGRISYSNLSPGHYTLLVKWSNGDGSWSDENAVFSLRVKQYIWLRWYALLLYSLMAIAVMYIIYSYRKNKRLASHQLEVEHLLREKDEVAHQSRIAFFTNIAHELQTPLTLIMGSAERSKDKTTRDNNPRENSYFLSLIHQQASKLTYLVHQLLDFRKAEAGYLENHYAYFNISELLQNLAEPFIPLSEKSRMEYDIRVEDGLSGWTDKDKLEKIIYNLLSNAFKHASSNEQVSFAAISRVPDREIEIRVSNPCSPMTQEELAHLFDQFYTSRQQEHGAKKFGTGIGLAFTQQLVSLLQGSISCRYENDRITFCVVLPVQQQTLAVVPAPLSGIANQPSPLYRTITDAAYTSVTASAEINNKHAFIDKLREADKCNILVVEDDANIRFLLKDILQEEYIVHEAADGLEGLTMIEKIMPDLVICDVMMPNLGGLELCNRVKNAPATCHVPFMILSARGSEDHHLEGYEVGADAYIAKPFQISHLKTRVKKLIEYRQRLISIFHQSDSANAITETDLPADDKIFLINLAKVIEENLADTDLNAVFLEKHFNQSKMQLYRKLKTMTGMTPGEFIRHLRLKCAAGLLLTTSLSVTEIFYRTGFNNQSYFFREFKKKYQYAPNEYREVKSAI
jgi:signal transduction histidine kinase/ligand-binding sensor domain-containing protein/DNA-binding response OmpR family regulator